MDTRLATSKLRMQQWQAIIQARIESGMTVSSWCDANGINIKSYYYWLHKIKAAMLEEDSVSPVRAFAELPAAQESHVHDNERIFRPELTLSVADITISIDSNTPCDLLSRVLEVIRHA